MAAVRRTLRVTGFVQGVGFRPFVYRLAARHLLGGWVLNDTRGVTICVEGASPAVDAFGTDLHAQLPGLARIDSCELLAEEPLRSWSSHFTIRQSRSDGGHGGLVTPDSFVCQDCVDELQNPEDRRHGYPLINCTNCGPRYSIIRGVPYDRPLTTMADFVMCPDCRKEYDSPADRRFHAQPNACWRCGPQVRLLRPDGSRAGGDAPVRAAVRMLREGRVLAVKALGGYQLMADPFNSAAVAELRARKERSAKPLALLAADSAVVARYAHVDGAESRLLESPARPIVLLRARRDTPLDPGVAPGSPTLGFMLPTTPLQHLLLAGTAGVLVATSGNAPDEPMARTEEEALAALPGLADAFLVHDRVIHTRVDDSIARVVPTPQGPAAVLLRRARGFVPDPLPTPFPIPPVLAVGAELKNTVCLGAGNSLHVGQHIGDLKTPGNQRFFTDTIAHLRQIFHVSPRYVAHDLHPDFHSTRYARSCPDMEQVPVQHHHAHMASCMADNGLDRPVIGVIFDGTGYGSDGTIWGGEFLIGDYRGFERAGHLGRFRLPGGDRAVREPARVAIALLTQHFGQDTKDLPIDLVRSRDPFEVDVLMKMTQRGLNAPVTSSMGRLFDAFSALLGVCEEVGYEGQAAIELENLIAWDPTPAPPWPLQLDDEEGRLVLNHRPWLEALVSGLSDPRRSTADLSRAFHESIVHAVVETCRRLSRTHRLSDVVLSGGVFLNQHLLVRTEQELTTAGLRVHTHRRVPTNDGGVSVGQAMVAAARAVAANEQS
ncbi:carbamoyltransferase HypF [Streptomyces sulfonofaciens]|uniref:Carbamoyltransferase n=1 Tax=Streptomyces sulfonofaciens TaxID=68272 RepID=A0A919G6M5_9ACTN|nr:carbamoyltransferase HypF [Streptomyces sulfonofaciens]GHH78995.1 carbamoyltransferase HypF [Streptomyces sulfonofaciens]